MRIFNTAETSPKEMVAQLVRPFLLMQEKEKESVRQIVEQVRARGDEALIEYTRRYDCPKMTAARLRVTGREFEQARKTMGSALLGALERVAVNIRRFHEEQRLHDQFYLQQPGMVLGNKYTPIERVGIHVPGFTAAYPSSLLMSVIPAQVAGVGEIAIATPASQDCAVPPATLATAHFLGLTEVYKMGGAQAIAAFAFGTESVPKVDKLFGAGRLQVMLAKQLVYGEVGVDGLYGPSEVLIIADGSARPNCLAADMLAQAEHNPDSLAILVTTEGGHIGKVEAELKRQVKRLERQGAAWQALQERGALIRVRELKEAVEIANLIAPEHLEIQTQDPLLLVTEIKHAGCILLGQSAPAAVGDYFAGPSHVLPTGGSARFSSGLGVGDFVKRSSVIFSSQQALREAAESIRVLASLEGFDAHYRSVALRLTGE